MGDLILINGEVKEAWWRLVKVLSKAVTGRNSGTGERKQMLDKEKEQGEEEREKGIE